MLTRSSTDELYWKSTDELSWESTHSHSDFEKHSQDSINDVSSQEEMPSISSNETYSESISESISDTGPKTPTGTDIAFTVLGVFEKILDLLSKPLFVLL